MQVSFERINEIYKTLPIGYYIGREVKSELSNEESTSYYNIINDKIVFSYPQIRYALNKLPEGSSDDEIEQFVRTMLYHELSHAILTPRDLTPSFHKNIIEDERIETLLDGYYFNTNFKKMVRALNEQGQINSFDDFFFDLVRFRSGPKFLLEELEDLIKNNGINTCNAYSEGWRLNSSMNDLIRHAREYYNENEDKIRQQSEQNQNESNSGNDQSGNSNNSNNPNNSKNQKNQSGNQKSVGQKSNETVEGQSEGQVGNNQEEAGNQSEGQSSDNQGKSEETSSNNDGTPGSGVSTGKFNSIKSVMNKVVNHYQNERLQQELDLVFNRAAKAHKIQGSAVNAYSGRFDPRSVVRDDYKYFVQQNRMGNQKGFSKVHLNLFIDRSGSYSNNVDQTNEILVALSKIERKTNQFTYTIISCGDGEKIEDKKNYIHKAWDGTRISKRIYQIFRDVQDKTSVNYNIVLYDGEAWDGYNFAAFNSANTAIISDVENRKNINNYAPSARKIFVNPDKDGVSYADVLQENVLKVLQGLVR